MTRYLGKNRRMNKVKVLKNRRKRSYQYAQEVGEAAVLLGLSEPKLRGFINDNINEEMEYSSERRNI